MEELAHCDLVGLRGAVSCYLIQFQSGLFLSFSRWKFSHPQRE